MLLLSMHALAVALPSIRLQPRAIERLFGPQRFATVPNFLDPALVAHLVADVHSLGARLTPAAASPAHGSVEWLMLSPDAPPQDDSDDVTNDETLMEGDVFKRLAIEWADVTELKGIMGTFKQVGDQVMQY